MVNGRAPVVDGTRVTQLLRDAAMSDVWEQIYRQAFPGAVVELVEAAPGHMVQSYWLPQRTSTALHQCSFDPSAAKQVWGKLPTVFVGAPPGHVARELPEPLSVRLPQQRLGAFASTDVLVVVHSAYTANDVPHSAPEAGAHGFVDGEFVITVLGASFDEHVQRLPADVRAIVRRDLRAHARAGNTTEIGQLSEVLGFAPSLASAVQQKHSHPVEVKEIRRVLEIYEAELGERIVTFVSRARGGSPAAYALAVVTDDVLWVDHVGMVYSAATRASSAYFEVCIHAPTAYAARHGLMQVHLGRLGARAKTLRGAIALPLRQRVVRVRA